ncbi:cobalamin biosynthesis protein [Parendozoicomonas sp. Alg238-R29]|uniref:cobalamin biosynthesis protein n=1 Tax=Parendozoicomonas sp. Alg238-R29 TaxID=2993446 RepID=UPI00248F3A49|nr:cobalamin biosynthesis protein [Parendozoicomonas sp. Alg238-R29]
MDVRSRAIGSALQQGQVINQSCYVVGLGSERGTPLEVIGQGVMQYLDTLAIDVKDVIVASIAIKKHDPAYDGFARVHGVPFITCDAVTLHSVAVSTDSGVPLLAPESVSERSALFFSGANQLLAPSFRFRLCFNERGVVVSVCRASA